MCKKYLALAAALMISSVLSVSFLTGTASAVSGEALTKKALLNGIKTCATTQYFKAPVSLDDLSGLDNSKLGSLFTSAGKKVGSHTVRIPTMVGNTVKDSDVSCLQLLQGYHKNGQDVKGLAEYSGKTVTQDSLTKIGYRNTTNPDAASVSQECVQITYKDKTKKLLGGEEWNDRETNKYCFWVEDGKIAITPSGDHNVSKTKPGRGKSGAVKLDGEYDKDGSHPGYWLSIWYMDEKDKGHTVLYTSAEQGDREWSDFKNGFANVAANLNKASNIKDAKVNFTVGSDSSKNIARDERALTFGGASSKLAMLKYFAGDDATWDSVKFTEAEKTDLYRKYIKGQIDDGKVKQGECGTLETIKSNQGDKEMYVYQPNANKDNYCILEGADQVTQKFNAPRAGNDILYPESFLTIVTAQMPKEIADKNKEIRNPAPADPDDDGNAEEASQCSTAGGSLGWIICPVVEKLGDAINGIYEDIEKQYLQVNPEFLTREAKIADDGGNIQNTERDNLEGGKTEDSGVYEGWKIFRDLANIVFVITLLVIILSQITGFGISNYGIKKMLPTLIMVAVLVNISFFLCQLAVDITNIVGYGIKDLFESINIDTRGVPANTGPLAYGIVEGLLAPAGAAVGITVLAFNWDIWIIPFTLLLLTTAISIIFFFILLGLRLSGIVVLTALSPIAIICYALPNTKNIFSRWWKLYFGLLIVYPICGILMGGGTFASKLLLSMRSDSTGYFYAFVAILIQIVPFFFVPSIVKSSFAAMGNLGMKLSNFGRNLGNSASRGIKHTEAYRDRQGRMVAHNANRKLNPWYNKNNKFAHFAGAPMRGISKAGEKARSWNNPVSRIAANTHNRKQNRLQSTVLAQNLANRDRSDYYEQKHMDELEGDYSSTWRNEGILNNDARMGDEMRAAYSDLIGNHENTDARARFNAAMRRLNKSDPGRRLAYSIVNENERNLAQNGIRRNKGMQWAANAILDDAGAEYKAKTPAAFENLGDLAADKRDFDASKIETDSKGMYINTDYRARKSGSIGAEQLMNTDDTYRQGAIDGLRNGSITGDNRNNLISQAREVMSNPNLNPKGDVARDMDTIANMDYAPPTGSTSSNASVNTVDGSSVRRMANASQGELDRIVRGAESGTIRNDAEQNINDLTEIANVAEATLNAANAGTVTLSQETASKLNRIRALDGRSEIPYSLRVQHGLANTAPVPDGFTENGSSIVIPRNGSSGDMTGSQIRDFERQMRQHNNNGGNNNRNGGNGGIILP